MDKQRRKELTREYKQIKTYMGVIQLRNRVNDMLFIGTSTNLKNQWPRLQAELDAGRHPNSALQADWKACGAGAFEFEVLEQRESDDVPNRKWALEQMLAAWLATLEPFGERGYNRRPER